MIDRRQFCSMTTSALMAMGPRKMFGGLTLQAMPSASGQGTEYVLDAPLGNPFYAWPRTLLSYPLEASVEGQHLVCVETRETVPFQISKMAEHPGGELLFFADLPAGTTRTYRFVAGTSAAAAGQTVQVKPGVGSITIDSGAMQVDIPKTQSVSGEAPGPIMAVARGGAWVGQSKLSVNGHAVTSIATEMVEPGPLRSTHRITYTFAGGGRYVATVQAWAGLDFIRLHEDMESLPADAQGQFDFAWAGCSFEHRQAPNHPYNFPRTPLANYNSYPWEKIAPAFMDTQFGVSPGVDASGRMPFALSTFEPWSDALAASFANFWSEKAPDAAGIFIDHIEQWQDHEYAIWHSSRRVAVEFLYRQSTLHFNYKIARGERSTCLVFYDHARDVEAMAQLEARTRGVEGVDGSRQRFRTGLFGTSYLLNLQNWHGTLDLDKTKDWQLSYPATAAGPKAVFKHATFPTAAAFYQNVVGNEYVDQLALSGTRQNHGFGPTGARQILESWITSYQLFRSQYTAAERRRLEAIFLLEAYVHAGEDYMPMQRMLAGHPNFLSDVKSTPPGMAFLFPEHPAADTWADEWEAYIHLNSRYHTRPAVEAWNAKGGRWTENLGTYVWAFLRPATRASFLLKARDGYERMCTPQVAQVGDWLVNALSAPFKGESPARMKLVHEEMLVNEGARRHYWGIVSEEDGPRRLHPPMGAHSERRKTPRTMWYLGTVLKNYSPMVSESLLWAARPTDQDMETPTDAVDPFEAMLAETGNQGTNPHLRTAKYTGYGITMRAAVDTPRELSIHLVQIDDGPNYRWGDVSEGSCGLIYFYANGKGYSHNGVEDEGDRINQDTDFGTNFGVWKNKAFRSIGQNVLSRPCYDLNCAQYAEIVPREGANAYSFPEYVGRSILLAGDDYFVIHDKVFNPEINNRFSWFVRKGDDFPHISILTNTRSRESGRFTSVETEQTSGRWSDGVGDSIAVVTHKEGIHAMPAPFGGRVTLPDGMDVVFASQTAVAFEERGMSFHGMAGILRDRKDTWEIALFHGTGIGAGGVSFATQDTELGLSAKIAKRGGLMEGCLFAPAASEVSIGLPAHAERLVLYLDGSKAVTTMDGGRMVVKIAAGSHCWELTARLPVPPAPVVVSTEYASSGAIVHGAAVAGATGYQAEISGDEAHTWQAAGVATEPVFKLSGLTNGKKYHVRLIARNAERTSAAGSEYPLYITDAPPPAPDGLHVVLAAGAASLTWGEVLGVTEYRVTRRKGAAGDFRVVYTGRATAWRDVDPAILPSAESPRDTPAPGKGPVPAFEYRVTASNHNGEGKPTRTANTDPASWRNWNPTAGEPFRRTVELDEGGLPNDGGGRHYPA